ncbi:MAG: prepilin peptidase [Kineosporiaceae bacterium]
MSPAVAVGCGVAGGLAVAALAPLMLRFQPSARSGRPASEDVPHAGLRWALLLGLLGGVAMTVTVWRAGPTVAGFVEAVLAGVLVLAAAVDARVGRLPNAVVLPGTLGVLGLLVAGHLRDPAPGSLTAAITAYAGMLVLTTVVALVLPRSLGMGDARYLALAALVLAYPSVGRLGLMLLLLLALNVALLGWLLLSRRGLMTRLPLGPSVCLATLLALWVSPVAT